MMTYKGFTAELEIDVKYGIIFGRVVDISDEVTFKGKTVEEVQEEFHKAIEDYLDFCDEAEREPDRPFSGIISFRTTGDRHRKIFLAAKKAGKTINAWMDDVLVVAAESAIDSLE